MVKRAKSPVLPDDATYLVVHQPYPLNANFLLSGDYIAFAFWAASAVGSPTPIWGIHHKPKARSTVILEVDKRLPRETLQAILGEHRWDEVLKEPREDEKERVSKVYFCLYKTQRAAQKDGWKRIHVEPEWFSEKGWNLTGGPFKHPYPDTHWCPPLPEDPTNKHLARPLPVSMKPPPPTAPALVPGSAQWVEAVEAGRPTAEQHAGAWTTRGARGSNRGNRGRPASQRPKTNNAAAGSSNTAATSSIAWSRIASSSSLSSPTSASTPPSEAYPAPPGLTRQPTNAGAPIVPPGLTKVQESLASMGLSDSEDEQNVACVPLDDDSGDDMTAYDLYTPADGNGGNGNAEAPVNLWAQVQKETKEEEEEEPMCTFHGKICPKGICAERKAMERKKKRDEEAAARAAKIEETKQKRKEKRKEQRKEKKEGGKDGDGEDEDGSTPGKTGARRTRVRRKKPASPTSAAEATT